MIKNDYCLEEFGENAAVLLVGILLSLKRVNDN
jgi:hypothetical protein